jgi:hypothetical protein
LPTPKSQRELTQKERGKQLLSGEADPFSSAQARAEENAALWAEWVRLEPHLTTQHMHDINRVLQSRPIEPSMERARLDQAIRKAKSLLGPQKTKDILVTQNTRTA